MSSFGIGLALLMAGFTGYLAQPAFLTWASSPDGFDFLKTIAESAWSWICIAVMVFGVVWFWILGPLLSSSSPKESP